MTTQLKPEEINELMRALGFHAIPSRKRWKMKLSDTIVVTDAQIKGANQNERLAEFLMGFIDEQLGTANILMKRKKVLSAFFK